MSIISFEDVFETINMIRQENLDIRTITMGISLLDCIDSDLDKLNELQQTSADKIYRVSDLELENIGNITDSSTRVGYYIIYDGEQ